MQVSHHHLFVLLCLFLTIFFKQIVASRSDANIREIEKAASARLRIKETHNLMMMVMMIKTNRNRTRTAERERQREEIAKVKSKEKKRRRAPGSQRKHAEARKVERQKKRFLLWVQEQEEEGSNRQPVVDLQDRQSMARYKLRNLHKDLLSVSNNEANKRPIS